MAPKAMKSKTMSKKPAAADESESSDSENFDGDEIYRSGGRLAMEKWAKAAQNGEKCPRPSVASQWMLDELRRMDNAERAAGNQNPQHLERYQSDSSKKFKQAIALKLLLDKDGYDQDMKMFDNNYREINKGIEVEEGWWTWPELAKLKGLPDNMVDTEKKELVLEWVDEERFDDRAHEIPSWAKRGWRQYHVVHQSRVKTNDMIKRKVGKQLIGHVDSANQQTQNNMISTELDADFNRSAGSSYSSKRPLAIEDKKRTKEEKAAQKRKKTEAKTEAAINVLYDTDIHYTCTTISLSLELTHFCELSADTFL